MLHDFWFGLWYFLPAGVANVSPIFAAHMPYFKDLNYPMDFGLRFKGKRLLGENKTWRGILFGTLMGTLFIYLQKMLYVHNPDIQSAAMPINYDQANILLLGALLAFGAVFGDAVESALKRFSNIKSGESWFPFDQLDYAVGGLLFSLIYVRLTIVLYAWIIVIWFIMHLIFSYLGYLLKMKEKPI